MPKVEIDAAVAERGAGYPPPYDAPCRGRLRRRLAPIAGLSAFGANVTRLPPGGWSSQRHWHSHEDELVVVLSGELVLVEDAGETRLKEGDVAAFPAGSGDGHHLINRSTLDALYLEIGSRHPDDLTICSDVDIKSANADGRFTRKDGTPI